MLDKIFKTTRDCIWGRGEHILCMVTDFLKFFSGKVGRHEAHMNVFFSVPPLVRIQIDLKDKTTRTCGQYSQDHQTLHLGEGEHILCMVTDILKTAQPPPRVAGELLAKSVNRSVNRWFLHVNRGEP